MDGLYSSSWQASDTVRSSVATGFGAPVVCRDRSSSSSSASASYGILWASPDRCRPALALPCCSIARAIAASAALMLSGSELHGLYAWNSGARSSPGPIETMNGDGACGFADPWYPISSGSECGEDAGGVSKPTMCGKAKVWGYGESGPADPIEDPDGNRR